MKNKLAIITIIAFIFQGCALKVGLLNPNPNISINESKQKLALVIDKSIKDIFTVPKKNSVKATEVTEWHTSLRKGFNNGFSSYYTITDQAAEADLIIKLTRADIEFAPAVVGNISGILAVNAQIKYSAQLLDSKGEVLKRSANTAVSKSAATKPGKIGEAVENAVESMYELISRDSFGN